MISRFFMVATGVFVVAACGASSSPTKPIGSPVGRWEGVDSPPFPIGYDPTNIGAWTGSDYVVWGGGRPAQGVLDPPILPEQCGNRFCRTGGVWRPGGSWRTTSLVDAPAARADPVVVASMEAVLVWGGYGCFPNQEQPSGDGGIYRPGDDKWAPVTGIGAPTPRAGALGVWTGAAFIVWGGYDSTQGSRTFMQDGEVYDPTADTWRAISSPGALVPAPSGSLTVWTGEELVFWRRDLVTPRGVAYRPSTDTWRAMSTSGAPGRGAEGIAWTGRDVVLWGGDTDDCTPNCSRYAYAYAPDVDRWRRIDLGLMPRPGSVVIGTAKGILFFGGSGTCCEGNDCTCVDGATYDPATDSWRSLPPGGPPGAPAIAVQQTGLALSDSVLIRGTFMARFIW